MFFVIFSVSHHNTRLISLNNSVSPDAQTEALNEGNQFSGQERNGLSFRS